MTRGLWARLFLLGGLLAAGVMHGAETVGCFFLTVPDSPESGVHEDIAEAEKWCYFTRRDGASESTFVFRGDQSPLRLETSALVKLDFKGDPQEITHGSLAKGELKIVRSRMTEVNPLPVPLDVKRAAATGRRAPEPLTDDVWLDAFRVMGELSRSTALNVPVYRLEEGITESYLDPELQPNIGYWWPYETFDMGAGPNSPLGKYDAIVENLTGTSPDSVSWEKEKHALTHVKWGGHCNGWAASSILYPDVTRNLWDSALQKVIFSSDIKGMLSEASFCVDLAFYGHRNYGKPGDDPLDIYPEKFHQVLVYYIDKMKKPIIFDRYKDDKVDNNLFTGYKFDIKLSPENPMEYQVTALLRAHDYEHGRNEKVGKAKTYLRPYKYTLQVDEDGKITGGKWLGDNPDFLWVPVGEKKCGSENPRVDADKIMEILKTLPDAKERSVRIGLSINQRLKPYEEYEIPLKKIKGSNYRVYLTNNLGGNVQYYFKMSPLYPNSKKSEPFEMMMMLGTGPQIIELKHSNLSQLRIVNGNQETPGNRFRLDKIEYLGGD